MKCWALVALVLGSFSTVWVERAEAWKPFYPEAYCPDGGRIDLSVHFRPPVSLPTADLFSGLQNEIQLIRECRDSGFPVYRKFDHDELRRIAALMKTDSYQKQARSKSPAALAMWIETELTGVVPPALSYGLKLHDASTLKTETLQDYYRALLEVVRDGYKNKTRQHAELARQQLQLAILSHKAGEPDASDWLDQATETLDAIPDIVERRRQRERIRRHFEIIKLCLSAPDDLEAFLCAGVPHPKTVHDVGYQGWRSKHGIEYLAHWVVDFFLFLPAKTADQLTAGNQILRSTQRERINNPTFKEYFDKFFISQFGGKIRSPRDCDLIRLIDDRGECGSDNDQSRMWLQTRQYYPDILDTKIVALDREKDRQRVLVHAARLRFSGDRSHRAVLWAKEQPDFSEALTLVRQKHLSQEARKAGIRSVQCALGRTCREPYSFEMAIRRLEGDDPTEYRKIFQNYRASQLEKEIRALSWCDVSVELGELGAGMCFTSTANPSEVSKLRSMTDRYDIIYAEERTKLLGSAVEQ